VGAVGHYSFISERVADERIRNSFKENQHILKFWNFDSEGKNQASGYFEDLIPTSKAKTVKGDSKNTINERIILNGSLTGVFVILFSYYRFR